MRATGASFTKLKIRETSVKIILLNEQLCRDAPCEKLWKQEVFLAILSRILAQSCVTPPYIFRQRVTHSILDSIAKKTSCFHNFSHGASLHHCSFSRMIFTLVYYSCDHKNVFFFVESAPISIISPPSLIAGSTVNLTCSIHVPYVVYRFIDELPEFEWHIPGDAVVRNTFTYMIEETCLNCNEDIYASDITLSEITTSQAGEYTCRASLDGSNTTSTNISVYGI